MDTLQPYKAVQCAKLSHAMPHSDSLQPLRGGRTQKVWCVYVCVCVAGSGAKEDKRHNCPRTRRDGPDMDTCPRPWSAVPSIPPATCPPTECTVTSAAARRDSVVTPDASQGRGDTDSDLICESHQGPEAVPWRGLNTVGTLILEPSIDVRLNAFQNNSHVLSPILPSPAIIAVL